MLLLSLFLAVQSPADSVQIITRDIPNFWRAYDQAAGKASAERTPSAPGWLPPVGPKRGSTRCPWIA